MNHEKPIAAGSVRGSCFATAYSVAPLLLGLLAGAPACGVKEHPHDLAAVDTSHDFGPPTTTPPTSTGTGGNANADSAPPVARPDAQTMTPSPTRDAAPGASSDAASPSVDVAVTTPTVDAAIDVAPPSNVTITIGGTAVAKENAIAFIHLGHSNMAGRATGPAATIPYFFRDVDPHAWMYHVGQVLQPALEPGTAGDGAGNQFAGPGTALLKQAAALAPGKYFVSLGFGQGSAYCSQFLPGALYYDMLIAAPKAIKGRVTFAAIVIMLGITERHGTAADITGYPSCINQLVTAIRTDVGEPNLPLLITDYEQEATGALAIDQAFAQSILPQIRMIPSVVANSALVPTDGLPMQDDHHFNLDGHKIWTGRVLQIMRDKGWFPWAP